MRPGIKAAVVAAGVLLSLGAPASAAGAAELLGEPASDPPYAKVSITAPDYLATVDTKNPVFSGTGESGASVVVGDSTGAVLCAARVSEGVWSCQSVRDMGNGQVEARVAHDAWGEISRDSIRFTVADEGASEHDAWAFPRLETWLVITVGGALLAIVAAASYLTVYLRKRRTRNATPAEAGPPLAAAGESEQQTRRSF